MSIQLSKSSISYKETAADLACRIEIHECYGGKNINGWTLEFVKIKEGEKILDLGCGDGKQCLLFAKCNAKVVGVDISRELLSKAKAKAKEQRLAIEFLQWDINRGLPFNDNEFDLVTCCFTIYYVSDIDYVIKEMYRVLKPRGRIFLTGPTPDNKREFYQLHKGVTKAEIPYMPGMARFEPECLPSVKRHFKSVDYRIFTNPLTFVDAEPFIQYYVSTISVDRQLWTESFQSEDHMVECINLMRDKVNQIIAREGKMVMKKVVGGILGYK